MARYINFFVAHCISMDSHTHAQHTESVKGGKMQFFSLISSVLLFPFPCTVLFFFTAICLSSQPSGFDFATVVMQIHPFSLSIGDNNAIHYGQKRIMADIEVLSLGKMK